MDNSFFRGTNEGKIFIISLTVNQSEGMFDPCIPLVHPLLKYPEVLNESGEPLEWLIKTRMTYVMGSNLQNNKTWNSTFSFLKHSKILCNIPFIINTEKPVQCLPKIHSSAGQVQLKDLQKMNPSKLWKTQVPPSQWEDIIQLLPVNTIGHPGTKSSGPDMLFRTLKPTVGYQAKLNSEENPLQWALIKEEIVKSSPIAEITPLCLIIVALHLGKEILQALGEEKSILLSKGNWFELLILLTIGISLKGN